jgi:hypothetical protein
MAQTFLLDGPVAAVGSANSGNIWAILPEIAGKINNRREGPICMEKPNPAAFTRRRMRGTIPFRD